MLVSPPSACRRVCVVNSHPIVIRCLLDSKLTLRVLRSLGSSSLAFCVHHPPSSTLLAFNSGSARPSVPWVCLLSPLRFAAGWVGAACLHLRRIGPRLNLCRPPLPSEGRSCHQGSLGWDISRLCHTSCLPQNGTQLVIICCVTVCAASSVHSAWKINTSDSSPSRYIKPPISMKETGTSSASSHEAWRDVKDYYESLDVWNFFCSVLSGNFRAFIDNTHSLSLGADVLARKLESLPATRFVGHTPFSIGLS